MTVITLQTQPCTATQSPLCLQGTLFKSPLVLRSPCMLQRVLGNAQGGHIYSEEQVWTVGLYYCSIGMTARHNSWVSCSSTFRQCINRDGQAIVPWSLGMGKRAEKGNKNN